MQEKKIRKFIMDFLNTWQLYAMMVVPLGGVIIFSYIPMYGIQVGFRDYHSSLGILGSEWVGLKYIERFVASPIFWEFTYNTIMLNLYGLIFSWPIPIVFALALNYVKAPKYKKIVQTITYAPHFISTVVIVSLLKQLLNPTYGIVNMIISFFGGKKYDFFAMPSAFRPIYIISGIWQNLGWDSIIYLSALAGIDPQLHEAARIDGASIIQRMWHIDLPGILPTIVILLIMSFGSFMSIGVEKVYMMQNDLNLNVSETINTYVYKVGIINANYSSATAIGLFQSIVGVILIFIVNAICKRLTETSLW